ncbi:hypothetical protein BXZ70DRAFT_918515 [Cristinia sonorae]|uniref:Uncharacterized protein n=1 Tax=Cristinia sonorae TaxID=1940300 RepID=A0A8K0UW56_9AGAR|nr:hypothetical protein BXZ70DRAFT_918515 [Cristinia sonorae]
MLADECPSPDCYGVPLVRPPKSGDEKDPRKQCVICGSIFVDQVDSRGQTSLVLHEAVGQRAPGPSSQASQILNVPPVLQDSAQLASVQLLNPVNLQPEHVSTPVAFQQPQSNLHTTLALESTMQSLTERLQSLSSAISLDVVLIGQTAEAISKVSHAILSVRELQRGA